jgi:hypothetical protein
MHLSVDKQARILLEDLHDTNEALKSDRLSMYIFQNVTHSEFFYWNIIKHTFLFIELLRTNSHELDSFLPFTKSVPSLLINI